MKLDKVEPSENVDDRRPMTYWASKDYAGSYTVECRILEGGYEVYRSTSLKGFLKALEAMIVVERIAEKVEPVEEREA